MHNLPLSWSSFALAVVMLGVCAIFARPVCAQGEDSSPLGVPASVETDAVPNSEDAADDPCIWIHPTDTSESLVIGTNKQGGLATYSLDGKQVQYVEVGEVNNVDLRYGFPLGDREADIVACNDRTTNTIRIFAVDPESRMLTDVTGSPMKSRLETYGLCMYRSAKDGRYYVFIATKPGEVEQWVLSSSDGKVEGTQVRTFDVGSQTEGCVADDARGVVYIGEEAVGVWRYGAEPGDDPQARTLVDDVAGGRLTADVEGIAMYHGPEDTGYLLVSSQGSDTFVIYRREGENEYVGSFKVEAQEGIDAVSGTDGIDVTSCALGDAFPRGLFVAQDDENDAGNQNFKLVPWESIAEQFEPALMMEPGMSHRE